MKKLIINSRGFILKVDASETCTTIYDSYKVKSPWDMESIIYSIKAETTEEYAINKRNISSMIYEWRCHNLCHSLHILRDRTKDVDLNIGQPWYIRVLYTVLSPFYLHFR